MIITDLISLSS